MNLVKFQVVQDQFFVIVKLMPKLKYLQVARLKQRSLFVLQLDI